MVEEIIEQFGLPVLFLIVGLESAGAWLPGETALIVAGVLASRGHFDIRTVIAVAAAAAILGDNGGYAIGRFGGRRVILRWRRLARVSDRVLPIAEGFFRRHGGKTVFFGRFFAVLRVTAAWTAGISHMPWWRFLLWNAAGGIAWALLFGLISFYLGEAAAELIGRFGVYGAIVVVVGAVIAIAGLHLWRRRIMRAEREAA